MVTAAIRTVLSPSAPPKGGFGPGGVGGGTGLGGGLGSIAAQNPQLAAAIMQSPAAQAALNPSINPFSLTGQGVPYGAYGNINQELYGGSPYATPYGMGGFGMMGGLGGLEGDLGGPVAGVPLGGMLPGMPGMAPILSALQQAQQQQTDTSAAGGGTGGATTTTTPTGAVVTTTPATATTPATTTTTTPSGQTVTTPTTTTAAGTPAATTTPTSTQIPITSTMTPSQQLAAEIQNLASGGTGTLPPTTPTTTPTTLSTTTPTTTTPTTSTSTVQVPGTTITIPVTTTTDPTTGQTTTTSTPPSTTPTTPTTTTPTTPTTPQQTARLQYQKWMQSKPKQTSNTQAGRQQYQQQLQAWMQQAPTGVHTHRQQQQQGWGHAGGVFGQQQQRRGRYQIPGQAGGVGGAGVAGGAGVGAGGAKSRLARACDCEVPPMAADLERSSLSYGKSECNRCTFPFSKGMNKPMILGDEFPYLHGYNFIPGEQVYVRTKVVLYGTDELEEEDTEPWIMEDSAIVNCDRTGAFVCHMDIDMDYVDGDTARGAGMVEAHGRHSGRYGRQRLDL